MKKNHKRFYMSNLIKIRSPHSRSDSNQPIENTEQVRDLIIIRLLYIWIKNVFI